MNRFIHSFVALGALSLLALPALADPPAPQATAPSPGVTPPPPQPAAQGKDKPDSLDSLIEQAGGTNAPPPAPKPVEPPPPPPPKPVVKVATPVAVKPAANQPPPPPPTDDNDATTEAARPTALPAVRSTGVTRRRGPYELGPLDCRVLDGAGIERILPGRIISGEEPDLLCRVMITQPADVASEEHSVTLTVVVGAKETFRQSRKVRMSSVGRRALVFVIPADKIATDDPATVKMQASLSPPSQPGGGRLVKFQVETED